MNLGAQREKLVQEGVIRVRPHGNSMSPMIKSGQLVTILRRDAGMEISKGDAVFCKVRGNYYIHLVKAVKNSRYLIANRKGRENGWISVEGIFGKVVQIGE